MKPSMKASMVVILFIFLICRMACRMVCWRCKKERRGRAEAREDIYQILEVSTIEQSD